MTHIYRWAHSQRVHSMPTPEELERQGYEDVSRFEVNGQRRGDPRYGARLYRKLDAPLLHASEREK